MSRKETNYSYSYHSKITLPTLTFCVFLFRSVSMLRIICVEYVCDKYASVSSAKYTFYRKKDCFVLKDYYFHSSWPTDLQ